MRQSDFGQLVAGTGPLERNPDDAPVPQPGDPSAGSDRDRSAQIDRSNICAGVGVDQGHATFVAHRLVGHRRLRENTLVSPGQPFCLGTLTSSEVPGEVVLLIPLGATEQHGPHLPLDTDTRIAVAWAEGLASMLTSTCASTLVLVAPPMCFGSSGEHQGFAGTMSVGGPVIRSVIVELARSVRANVAAVVFVNGHSGNHEPVTGAVHQLRNEGHAVAAVFPVVDGGDAHAGHTETSLMLHLHPELVRLDRAEPGRGESMTELMTALKRDGVRSVSPNGVLGDPTGASAAHGRQIFERLIQLGVTEVADTIGVL